MLSKYQPEWRLKFIKFNFDIKENKNFSNWLPHIIIFAAI